MTVRFSLDIDKAGYRWQRRFYEFAKFDLHDPRVITWVADFDGDKGKTLFIKWFIREMKSDAVLMDITNFKEMSAHQRNILLSSQKHDIQRGATPIQEPPSSIWSCRGAQVGHPTPENHAQTNKSAVLLTSSTFASVRIRRTFGPDRISSYSILPAARARGKLITNSSRTLVRTDRPR